MTIPTIKSCDQEINPDLFKFLDEYLPFRYDSKVFEWEYGHADKVFCYLESLDGKVLGAQGMIPIKLHCGSQLLSTAKSETSYLAAEAQGQGLFSKLYKKTLEHTQEKGLELIWGFTSLGPVWKKLGFHVQNDCLLNCEVQLRPSTLPKEFLKLRRWLGYFKSALLAVKTAQANKRMTSGINSITYTYSESTLSTKDIQSVHEKIQKDNPQLVALDMNEEFFEQRITKNPFIDYAFGSINDSQGQMLGYYILATKPGAQSAYLSDVSAVNNEVKQQLISQAITKAKADGCRTLKLFGNRLNPLMKQTLDLLDQFGTRKMDSGMYLVVKPLSDEQVAAKHNFDNWYINGLWTEGITQ
ncbi:MAG: GNAT superfamily N-acetyltransferase [Flavobacteriales bacterium]|jgi:GNAT superfamily N-acetyltransferase